MQRNATKVTKTMHDFYIVYYFSAIKTA